MRVLFVLVIAQAGFGQPRYVGSKACAACHPGIYKTYTQTAMGRSMSRPLPELVAKPVTVRNEALNREYRVMKQGAAVVQSMSERKDGQTVFEIAHLLEFAIGSGQNGISFVVKRGGHLFQAPLSYYSAGKLWDLSPGFGQADQGFNRPIAEGCIDCHSGRAQIVSPGAGRFADPPFAELAIGCENCHGPGDVHVTQRLRNAGNLPDSSIVNPKRLPARLAEDICMRCHQAGDVRVLMPNKKYSDFRPGKRLLETVAIFGLTSEAKNADLLDHHSSMKMSRCYRASEGKLSCLTCHDPHVQPSAASAPVYFRNKCLGCHNQASCKLDAVTRGPADDCISCHMPRRAVENISHSTLTNHRIPARADSHLASTVSKEDMPGLLLLDEPEGKFKLPLVTRLAAYGELIPRRPEFERKYFELLEEARKSAPDDPLVLAAVGRKLLSEGNPDAWIWLNEAEQKGVRGEVTYTDLSEALTRAGRVGEAASALERGAGVYPFSQSIRKRLISAYIQQKDYALAKAALEHFVDDFPEDGFMRRLRGQARKAVQ